jgi:tetratricopeptide (TPR) repeat protein
VKQLAGIFESDSVPAARAKLEGAVAGVLPPDTAADVAAHLAALVGIAGEETIQDKQVLFFSVRRFVEALAAARPLVLLFEDIHWADPSLLDLIEHLAGRLRDTPILLLTLARPELLQARPSWGGGLLAYTALPLESLRAEDARRLAVLLLEQRAGTVEQDVADRLGETAEGNPLFIEELAASFVEQAAGSLDELPTSVRGIIAARLDALPAAERAVILDASVVGKIFWPGALRGLGSGNGRLFQLLDSLEARDFIRREASSRIEGDDEYSFKHMLIREVAYATLPKAVRRERHAAVARFIEGAAGDRIGESAAVLAYHWEEGGDRGKALDYTITAAEQAARAWAKGEAVSLYARALDLMPEDDERRGHIRLARALALVEAGDHQAAVPELDVLLGELQGRDRFEALLNRFKASFWGLTDALASRRFAEEARKLAEELGDEQLRALAVSKQAAAAGMDGHLEEAIALADDSFSVWKRASRLSDRAEALDWYSLHNYWLGRYESAVPAARDAIEVGRGVHSIPGLVNGHANLALALTGLGRHEEALEVFARGTAHGRELELRPRFTARIMNMWGGTLRELYELEEARRLHEEAIDLASRSAFAGAEVSGRLDLLQLDLAAGAWPGLCEAAAATKGWHQWLWMTRLAEAKGGIELAAGRAEQAAEDARKAIEQAGRYRRLKYVVASRIVLGLALLELKREAVAGDVLRQALAEAEKLRHPPSIWRAAAGLMRALDAVGDDGGAGDALRRARETIDAFAAGLSEERRERFLGAPELADVLALD